MFKLFKQFWKKYFNENESRILFYIFAFALLLRIGYIVETQGSPFFNNLFSDSKIYQEWAMDISENGDWAGDEVFFMAPAYPYFLAAAFSIVGNSIYIVRLLQALLSSFTIYLLFLVGRNLFSRSAGYISAGIAASYSIFIFYSGAILSETLQVFFISALLLLITKKTKDISLKRWFYIGLMIGIAALFRASILMFLGFAAIWLIYRLIKKTVEKKIAIQGLLLLFLGAMIPILPVTIRNYIVADDLVLLTSNGGINFYLGNNKNSAGVFIAPQEFDFYSDLSGQKYAQSQLGIKLKASEASSYWYGRGTDYIISDPTGWLMLEVKKLFLLFGESELPQSSVMDKDFFAENYSSVLTLPLVGFLFISMFSITGIILTRRSLKDNFLIWMFLAANILAVILFFVNGRFRMALTPLLIVFAAAGIIELFKIIKEKNFLPLKAPAAIIAVFFIGYYFIINVPRFTPYDAYFHLGKVAMDEKKYDTAVDYFNQSLFYREYFQTYVNLANALALKKDFDNALKIYDLAIKKNPDYLLAYFNKGLAYTQMGDFNKALEQFDKVLQMDPDYENAYRNIGIIYYVNEEWEKALPFFEKFVELTKDEELKASVNYDIETIRRKIKQNGADKKNEK